MQLQPITITGGLWKHASKLKKRRVLFWLTHVQLRIFCGYAKGSVSETGNNSESTNLDF